MTHPRGILDRDRVLAIYGQGYSIRETANQCGITYERARRVVRSAGVARPRGGAHATPRLPEHPDREKQIEAYRRCGSIYGAARELGMLPETLRYRLRVWGEIPQKKRGPYGSSS